MCSSKKSSPYSNNELCGYSYFEENTPHYSSQHYSEKSMSSEKSKEQTIHEFQLLNYIK